SLALSFIYAICDYSFPSPVNKIFSNAKFDNFFSLKTYFIVNQSVTFASFLLGKFFLLGNLNDSNESSNLSFFSKFLRANIYSFFRIYNNNVFNLALEASPNAKLKYFYLMLLSYLLYFSINYSIEIVLHLIEKQGMFSGNNLPSLTRDILFIDFSVFTIFEIKKNSNSFFNSIKIKSFQSILIPLTFLFIFQAFAFLYNIKWEVPIESNNIISQDNKGRAKFGFRFITDVHSILSSFFYMNILSSIFKYYFSSSFINIVANDNIKEIINKSILCIEELTIFKYITFRKNDILASLLILLIILGFEIMYNYVIFSRDASLNLRYKGVYFNNIDFGTKTKWFLFDKVMKLFIVRILFIILTTFIYEAFIIKVFNTITLPSAINLLYLVSNTIETIEQATSYKKFTEFYD
ncbi:MAG TPA: hypothetical protein VN854_00085, partial [Mycoplasmatales bacterium]|nr:hypothetical protein [Mycoplasmatales bacterium]